MNITELIKELVGFYVDLVGSLAWPVVALIALLLFRSHIVELSTRLKKFEGKGVLAEFEPIILEEKVPKADLVEITDKTCNWDHYLNALEWWGIWVGYSIAKLHELSYSRSLSKKELLTLDIARRGSQAVLHKLEKERPDSHAVMLLHEWENLFKFAPQHKGTNKSER